MRLAIARRDVALASPDTAAQATAVEFAQRALADAQEALTAAEEGTLTFLPASEVLYLSGLPRRVDEVYGRSVEPVAQSAVMRVSGAELIVAASAAESDAKLLTVGDTATVAVGDDGSLNATVTALAPRKATGKEAGVRYDVTLALVDPTPEQVQSLQGQNVRIAILRLARRPVRFSLFLPRRSPPEPATKSRVEVVVPGEEDTKLVAVTTGLAAEGFVEISGEITEGEQVVVGR